jgi:hypothetical protein
MGKGMQTRALVFSLVFAGTSFALAQSPKPNEIAPDTLITLQRGACEQRCAVYRLVIFADGTVIYEGRHFVHRAGLVKSGISPVVLAGLIKDMEIGGFFELADNYGYASTAHCDSVNSDLDGPTAVLSVSNQGRAKTVLHHHRCVGAAADRMTNLEDKVDRAVGSVKWIK